MSDELERIEGVLAAVNRAHTELLVHEAKQAELCQKLEGKVIELEEFKEGLENTMAWIISRYSHLALEKTLRQVIAEEEQKRKSGGKQPWAIQ